VYISISVLAAGFRNEKGDASGKDRNKRQSLQNGYLFGSQITASFHDSVPSLFRHFCRYRDEHTHQQKQDLGLAAAVVDRRHRRNSFSGFMQV
jgi:hypothetical protein